MQDQKQRELEAYEEAMLRRHAENQKQRSAQLGAMKAKAEE